MIRPQCPDKGFVFVGFLCTCDLRNRCCSWCVIQALARGAWSAQQKWPVSTQSRADQAAQSRQIGRPARSPA